MSQARREPVPTSPPTASPPRNVTIQDVARHAGVGRQTVSNVLNGAGRVGPATRQRVLEAVELLGYRPHHSARSLRSNRTLQLGYPMPAIQLRPANLIMLQFLQALVTAAASRNYAVVLLPPEPDGLDTMRRVIVSRSVDAFVLSELLPSDPRADLLYEHSMPFACFGRTRPGLPQHWVDIDNETAATAAVDHVIGRGFRRLAYVGYRPGPRWDAERAAGFRAGLLRNGISADGAGVLLVDDDPSARARIGSFLAEARPTGVVTGSDRLAAAVYTAAAEQGLRVGHDLAVTGFDGSVLGGLLQPRLTSVAIPVDVIAERVIQRALHHLEHGPDTDPGEIIPAALYQGEST